MKFYNRENELKLLNEKINKTGFDLLVLSGRRRVGKTELIKHLNNITFYFYVSEENEKTLLNEFSEKIKNKFNEELIEFTDWNIFFKYLISKAKSQKIVVVFDEFQNFKKINPAFFSIFQKHLEEISRQDLNLKFICTGSYINMIKDIFNNSSSALYGRKTGEMLLKPLEFKYINEYLTQVHNITNKEEIINIYGLFGGIPRYYALLEKSKIKNYIEVLNEFVFNDLAVLKSEIRDLFFENILNIKKEYISILKAISLGHNTNKKISDYTKIIQTSLPKYLDELENIYEIIQRQTPITQDTQKSKRGIYKIKDYFLLFWFRFIEKYNSYYQEADYKFIKEKIKLEFTDFIGKNCFENLTKEYVKTKYKGFLVGSWWQGKEEIDICAHNYEKEYILGEAKWSNKKIGFTLYNQLIEKSKKIGNIKIKKLILFSKSGFEQNLINKKEELNLELVDINKLFKELT
ncbi:MAG: ATP-binding protein [Nanoarchaeota archaeon]